MLEVAQSVDRRGHGGNSVGRERIAQLSSYKTRPAFCATLKFAHGPEPAI
jgi:hypothetical protein